uniref:DUF2510 domain-containing protein n=1 Tax=Frankia gtarii TaxID=2950102 RepID=UPI0021C088C5
MTQTVPPGWYADPSGQHGSRWWDGNQWTEHIQPAAPQAQYGGADQYGGAGQYGGAVPGQGAAVPGQ